MDLRSLQASPEPGLVSLVVEIPAGSSNKDEYNEKAGVLHSSVRFIPNTLVEDGAPLDVLVIMQEPTVAGSLIRA
jgi:inorganic pyrophosphatase